MESTTDKASLLAIALLIIGIIVTVMMVVAILQIPKIAKYQRATLKLTALIARREGVDRDIIQEIVNDADTKINSEDGNKFEKALTN